MADALRTRIVRRDLGERGALPGELDLAAEYGTSRVTVRRALDLLRREGLVTSRRGAGWFAAGGSAAPAARPGEDRRGRGRGGRRPTGPAHRRVRFRRGLGRRRRRDLHLDRGAEVLRVERVNLADDEPFALVTVWVRADLGADVSRADVERTTFYDLLPVRGVELEAVHQTITAEIAGAESAELLDCEPGDALPLLRRVTCEASGAPALYSEHRYPADRTSLEIEFSLRAGAHLHV